MSNKVEATFHGQATPDTAALRALVTTWPDNSLDMARAIPALCDALDVATARAEDLAARLGVATGLPQWVDMAQLVQERDEAVAERDLARGTAAALEDVLTRLPQEFAGTLQALARRAHCREDHDMLATRAGADESLDGLEVSSPETAQRVLDFLKDHPTVSVRTIGEELAIGRQTAANAVRLLRRDGSIEIARKGTGWGYPTTYRVVTP